MRDRSDRRDPYYMGFMGKYVRLGSGDGDSLRVQAHIPCLVASPEPRGAFFLHRVQVDDRATAVAGSRGLGTVNPHNGVAGSPRGEHRSTAESSIFHILNNNPILGYIQVTQCHGCVTKKHHRSDSFPRYTARVNPLASDRSVRRAGRYMGFMGKYKVPHRTAWGTQYLPYWISAGAIAPVPCVPNLTAVTSPSGTASSVCE